VYTTTHTRTNAVTMPNSYMKSEMIRFVVNSFKKWFSCVIHFLY